jgi:hypothetical protein
MVKINEKDNQLILKDKKSLKIKFSFAKSRIKESTTKYK